MAGQEGNSGRSGGQPFVWRIVIRDPQQTALLHQIGMLQRATLQFQNTASALMLLQEAAATREAAAVARLTSAMDTLTSANTKIAEATAKIAETMEAAADLVSKRNKSEDAARRATSIQAQFDKVKSNVRGFGLWVVCSATDDQLKEPWIQFDDEPRAIVDGLYLRNFLTNKEDMTEDMGRAVVRVMRMDEAERRIGPEGHTHYVMHHWAKFVLETGSTAEDSEDRFLEPNTFHYDLAMCGKVVAMLHIDGQWASVSVNLQRGITLLIHPAESAKPYSDVLDAHRPMMERLTSIILAHMTKLANTRLPETQWEYDVALKNEDLMRGQDTGISTAYYSIPRNNQFVIQSRSTIFLAKLTFIHSAVRACVRVTRKRAWTGWRKYMPRGPFYDYLSDDDAIELGIADSDSDSETFDGDSGSETDDE